MKFLQAEDKVKEWIENHRVKWVMILFGLGISLGVLQNFLLGGNPRQLFMVSVGYGLLLCIIETAAGGSGVN